MAAQYTTIQDFMDSLYLEPILRGVPMETVVRYCVDFMRIVGAPKMFSTQTAIVEIDSYKGELPCDFFKMVQVRNHSNTNQEAVYRYATDTFHLTKHEPTDFETYHDNELVASEVKYGRKHRPLEYTYTIQGNVIYTSTEDEDIEISYLAIAVDKNGVPLIPDNASFFRALKNYIIKERLQSKFYQGQLDPRILHEAQQQYYWSVGDCESEFNRLSIDEAESFYNMWSQLLMKNNDHARHFEGTGRREKIKPWA